VDPCGFHEHLLCAKERNMLVGRARLFGTSALCQEERELLSSVSIAGQFLLILNTLVMVLFSYINVSALLLTLPLRLCSCMQFCNKKTLPNFCFVFVCAV
jgi:hypothetical protein